MRTRLAAVLAAGLLVASACSNEPAAQEQGWSTAGVEAASSPVAAGDTVAVVDGASTDLKMLVLDAATGRVRFTRPWSPSARYGGIGVGRPALFDSVVVGIEPDDFQALLIGSNPATGEEIWRAEVSETFGPFVCGDLVCSEDNWSLDSAALVARDPGTGQTRWTSPGSQTHVYAEGGLLVEQDLNEPVLRSIDPATGSERWRTDLRSVLGPEATPVVSQAQLADGTLVVESNANRDSPNGTVGLDPNDGSVKWNHPDFGLCPRPAPGILVVCGGSGLRRLDPSSGEALWSNDQFRPPADSGPLLGVTPDLTHLLGNAADNLGLAINLENGEVSEPEGGLSFMRFFSNQQAKRGPDAPAGQYVGPLEPVPWDFEAGRPATVSDAGVIPDFIGLTLQGARIFLDAAGNLVALPA